MDLVWSAVGLTWELLLDGGNVQQLMSDAQGMALANAVDQNPVYQTPEGWLMANALVEMLLAG